MTNDLMREAFEAWADGNINTNQSAFTAAKAAWEAAYRAGQQSQGRRDAYNKGFAAGMERAAGICDRTRSVSAVSYETGAACADAIRAEIPKGGKE